ncbi:MAG: hypothetical protein VKO64_08345 [Candidatus Sericytochromatia bacterium]|nr:hypothetical protein [Candidatus Sericytochromatia bacterium]
MRKGFRICYRLIGADGTVSGPMSLVLQAHSPQEARQMFQFRYPKERYQFESVAGA